MHILLLFLFGVVSGTFIKRTELEKYTRIANSRDGYPCLGGCSPTTNECVVNWLWQKKPCKLENVPAPIYYTSQVYDKTNKICLSNCGKFGFPYEWCITTKDNKWDFCSSELRTKVPSTGRRFIESYTKEKQLCQSDCRNKNKQGYACYLNIIFWNNCAKPAISRVPILSPDFKIGNSTKQNCDAFLTNMITESIRANVSYYNSEYAPDFYLQEVADSIETAVMLAPESGLTKDVSEAGSAIKNYTMTNMILANGTTILVPAVIRAVVSNSTLRHNQPLIDIRTLVERNRRRRQLAYDNEGYFNWRIIGYELGGSDEDYNFIRQSPNLYESWLQLQRATNKWCSDTGGSVTILVVVFYPDVHTTLPKAIGASMIFNNPDDSLFVSCKNTIYWNY